MDEPFSALDAQNKLLLQEELLRIWEEQKKTVVFITHSVDEAVFLGDRIMVMTAQPGRVKSFVDVPLARPRNLIELQKAPEYGELVHRIWSGSARRSAARPRAGKQGRRLDEHASHRRQPGARLFPLACARASASWASPRRSLLLAGLGSWRRVFTSSTPVSFPRRRA